jgi:hypothetical protein
VVVKEGGRIDYSIEADVCCCGEPMEGHSSPINCGHTPVSQLDHFIISLQDERDQLREHLKIAIEALEYYCEPSNLISIYGLPKTARAHEALKDIKGGEMADLKTFLESIEFAASESRKDAGLSAKTETAIAWENGFYFGACWANDPLEKERDELRAAAEKLADALNNITICSSRDGASYQAAQALADYRAKFPKGET